MEKIKIKSGLGIMLAIIIAALALTDCDTKRNPYKSNTSTPKVKAAPKWYEGGTLRKATVGEWKKASARDKLATCADYVAIALDGQGITVIPLDKVVKPPAMKLRAYIDKTVRGLDYTDNMKVTDIAVIGLHELKVYR